MNTFRTLSDWVPPFAPVQLPSAPKVAPATMRPAPRPTLADFLAEHYRPSPVRPDYANLRTVALAFALLLAVPALHFALCLIP